MDIFTIILTVAGLCLFEVISSIDNAIINAEVLSGMSPRARRWFLIWGLLFAVVAVRGLLPWVIIWVANPSLGPIDAFLAAWSSDPHIMESINQSAPILLAGGGIFLVFLFFHWLFLEEKNYGLPHERFFHRNGVWFFATVSIILAVIVWHALKINQFMAFGAVIGSTVFFITHGFKENAEQAERMMLEGEKGGAGQGMGDLAKIFYLEAIDATFSIDGVLGAFAFTLSVPLIFLGNGVGALVLRQLTISNIEKIKRYAFLKNGAMYSVLVLGVIMLLDSFGVHIPQWVSPVSTFAVVGYFFWMSKKNMVAVV
jgi:hypothetical protein